MGGDSGSSGNIETRVAFLENVDRLMLQRILDDLDKNASIVTDYIMSLAGKEARNAMDVINLLIEETEENRPSAVGAKAEQRDAEHIGIQSMLGSGEAVTLPPSVFEALMKARQCWCEAQACSTATTGCAANKPVKRTLNILGGMVQKYKAEKADELALGFTRAAVEARIAKEGSTPDLDKALAKIKPVDAREFTQRFVLAFILFGNASRTFIGKECTAHCKETCTQVQQQVDIPRVEDFIEEFGWRVNKSEANPYGLFKILYMPPNEALVAEKAGFEQIFIGAGIATMNGAPEARAEGFAVTTYDAKSFKNEHGQPEQAVGGEWYRTIPDIKRHKSYLIRHGRLQDEMGISRVAQNVGEEQFKEMLLKADRGEACIHLNTGVGDRSYDLGIDGEKDASGKDANGFVHFREFLEPFNDISVDHFIAGGSKAEIPLELLKLAASYSGKTIGILGGGLTAEDCQSRAAKVKYLVDSMIAEFAIMPEQERAQEYARLGISEDLKPVTIISVERQPHEKVDAPSVAAGSWSNWTNQHDQTYSRDMFDGVGGQRLFTHEAIRGKSRTYLREDGKRVIQFDVSYLKDGLQIEFEKRERQKVVIKKSAELEADIWVKALGQVQVAASPRPIHYQAGVVLREVSVNGSLEEQIWGVTKKLDSQELATYRRTYPDQNVIVTETIPMVGNMTLRKGVFIAGDAQNPQGELVSAGQSGKNAAAVAKAYYNEGHRCLSQDDWLNTVFKPAYVEQESTRHIDLRLRALKVVAAVR